MQAHDQLSQLIARIYDAALDPALWPQALEGIIHFVGGSAAALMARDVASKSGNLYHSVGAEPRYAQLYFDTYVKFDPLAAAHLVFDVEEVFSSSKLMPHAEFVETRLYQEWVRPQGWIDHVFVTFEKSGTSLSGLSVVQHERDGFADEATCHRMRLVAPHVRRAVLIGSAMEHKTAEAAAFADTLDRVSAGMYLVDANGRIVHANASGQALLAQRTVLRSGGGKLAAIAAGADRQLSESLALAGSGDAAVGVKGIAVPLLSRDGEHYVAHALPLTSGARRRASVDYAAVAALFVRKTALATSTPPETIARLYNLTPSELRVLLAVVDGGSMAEIAEVLGIGVPTVKTHLQRLFSKTGTSRQSELVKLVAAFSNPLVS